MHAAILVFPGSNCDRDLKVAFEAAGAAGAAEGVKVSMIWHKDQELPHGVDIVAVPGGFSFGDYLRCGAIAANSPVSEALRKHVARGGYALGICNGFQVLTETGLLPGALRRNADQKFTCKTVALDVATQNSVFTSEYSVGQRINTPIANHDGNYFVDADTLAQLRAEDRIAFTYVDNPNGSVGDIAGVLSANRRVLGMMPHPERAADAALGGTDGVAMFRALSGLAAGIMATA